MRLFALIVVSGFFLLTAAGGDSLHSGLLLGFQDPGQISLVGSGGDVRVVKLAGVNVDSESIWKKIEELVLPDLKNREFVLRATTNGECIVRMRYLDYKDGNTMHISLNEFLNRLIARTQED